MTPVRCDGSVFPKSAIEPQNSSSTDHESSGAGWFEELGNRQKFFLYREMII